MPRRGGGFDSEISSASSSRSARAPEPRNGNGGRDAPRVVEKCKLHARFIVLVSQSLSLFIVFLLLVVPTTDPRLVDTWKLSQLFCYSTNETVFTSRPVASGVCSAVQNQPASNSGRNYVVGYDVVTMENGSIDNLRGRFRTILAMGFMILFSTVLEIASALSPNLQADSTRCRLMCFIGFSFPTCVGGLFLYFDCLQPLLDKSIVSRDQMHFDNELNFACWLIILASWRSISRSTMLACNSFSTAIGGGIMMVGLMSFGAAAEGATATVTPGDFIVVSFGAVICAISAVGLFAAKKESEPMCKIYVQIGGLFTAFILAMSIMLYLYPEAMNLFLLSHCATLSGALGGLSKVEYNMMMSKNSSFVGIVTTLICTIIVLNLLAAVTYRRELVRDSGGGSKVEEVEFVDIFERRKQREAAFRAKMAEEGSSREAQLAAGASGTRGGLLRSGTSSSDHPSAAGGKRTLKERMKPSALPKPKLSGMQLPGRKPAPEKPKFGYAAQPTMLRKLKGMPWPAIVWPDYTPVW
ncbi:hypothetical protein T492DRAFT_1091639 [Pavlovales sp. CCMP2436]|nr:hypothetical protein T492DRAFT_1091639 [Pavlovales sp. CCMP2436]